MVGTSGHRSYWTMLITKEAISAKNARTRRIKPTILIHQATRLLELCPMVVSLSSTHSACYCPHCIRQAQNRKRSIGFVRCWRLAQSYSLIVTGTANRVKPKASSVTFAPISDRRPVALMFNQRNLEYSLLKLSADTPHIHLLPASSHLCHQSCYRRDNSLPPAPL